jgi:hypothetical protein
MKKTVSLSSNVLIKVDFVSTHWAPGQKKKKKKARPTLRTLSRSSQSYTKFVINKLKVHFHVSKFMIKNFCMISLDVLHIVKSITIKLSLKPWNSTKLYCGLRSWFQIQYCVLETVLIVTFIWKMPQSTHPQLLSVDKYVKIWPYSLSTRFVYTHLQVQNLFHTKFGSKGEEDQGCTTKGVQSTHIKQSSNEI